jgi:nucleotide-binding universal stress UspA family protein
LAGIAVHGCGVNLGRMFRTQFAKREAAMAFSIVVGYDGSEMAIKALDTAVEFAKMVPDGEIIIACAEERSGPAVGFRGPEMGVEEYWEKLSQKIQAHLEAAAERVRKAGVKCATTCTPDRADETVINVARDVSARLIVVGTKGAGARPGERTALGSTTTRVLHEAGGIPVLVV